MKKPAAELQLEVEGGLLLGVRHKEQPGCLDRDGFLSRGRLEKQQVRKEDSGVSGVSIHDWALGHLM